MTPKTYLVGKSEMISKNLYQYLNDTGQEDFYETYYRTKLPTSLLIVSTFAKLCYKSLVLGKNKNVTKIRSVEDNIKNIIDSGHGSVLEHVVFNFITTNCSRIFTHELVRHRVGTAFSQTSGRYCAIDENSEIVLDDPILEKYKTSDEETFKHSLQYLFNELQADILVLISELPEKMSFDEKKKITSALRRIMPNGQTNEIAWSANLRALRHIIEMRTSIHAEWEIRHVFTEVAEIIKKENSLYLYGGIQDKNGSWSGLKC